MLLRDATTAEAVAARVAVVEGPASVVLADLLLSSLSLGW
jgi:hypothetical protein